MTGPSKSPLAERLQRHRRGVATRLDEIKASLDNLREDVRALVETSRPVTMNHKDHTHV